MFNLDKKIKTKKKKSWTFKASNVSKFFDEHVKKSVPFYGFSHEIKSERPFFRKGTRNQWQEKLSQSQINKIENEFKDEMKFLGYLK